MLFILMSAFTVRHAINRDLETMNTTDFPLIKRFFLILHFVTLSLTLALCLWVFVLFEPLLGRWGCEVVKKKKRSLLCLVLA